MVGHYAKRKNPNPTVGLVTPHQFYKSFLFQLAQNKVPVYHSGNTMVVSDLHRSLCLESRAPHTPLATDAKGKRFYQSVCPLRSPPQRDRSVCPLRLLRLRESVCPCAYGRFNESVDMTTAIDSSVI